MVTEGVLGLLFTDVAQVQDQAGPRAPDGSTHSSTDIGMEETSLAAPSDMEAKSIPAEPTAMDAKSNPAAPTDMDAGPSPAEPTDMDAEPIPAAPTDKDAGPSPAEPTAMEAKSIPAAPTDMDAKSIPAEPTDMDAEPIPAAPTDKDAGPSPAEPTAVEAEAFNTSLISGLLLERPATTVDVTQRGVTLSYLEQVVTAGLIKPDWTIQESVDLFVRPFTSANKCPLHSMVPAQHKGLPRFFVSHTWSGKVGDLLQLLLLFAQQQARLEARGGDGVGGEVEGRGRDGVEAGDGVHARARVVGEDGGGGEDGRGGEAVVSCDEVTTCMLIWLDIMAIPQHPYKDRGVLLNEDVSSLAKVVAATDRTVLCLDVKCIVLTRIWYLFEVWQTLLAKGVRGLLVLMPKVEVEKLQDVFDTFDVTNAQATQIEDRDRILREIGESIGATQLNLQLKAAIVDSATFEADTSSAQGSDRVSVLNKCAQLLQAAGQYTQAVERNRRALELAEQAVGPDSTQRIEAMWNLGNCLNQLPSRSDVDKVEIETLLLKALHTWKRVLGEDHPDTVSAAVRIAAFYVYNDRSEEGEPLLRTAVDARRRSLGPEHPETMKVVIELVQILEAIICNNGGSEHRPQLQEEMDQLKEEVWDVLGRMDNEEPAAFECWTSWMDHECIDAEQAEPIFRDMIEGSEKKLGRDHPRTIEKIGKLADLLCNDDQHDAAADLLQQIVHAWGRVLGPRHPTMVAAMNDLAGTLSAGDRPEEAREMYCQVLELYRSAYGSDHNYTQSVEEDIKELDERIARGCSSSSVDRTETSTR
eukprot:gene26142-11862_t